MSLKISKNDFKNFIGTGIILGLEGFVYVKNEIIQEARHFYFSLTKQPYEKVQRGEIDSLATFPEFKTYVKKY